MNLIVSDQIDPAGVRMARRFFPTIFIVILYLRTSLSLALFLLSHVGESQLRNTSSAGCIIAGLSRNNLPITLIPRHCAVLAVPSRPTVRHISGYISAVAYTKSRSPPLLGAGKIAVVARTRVSSRSGSSLVGCSDNVILDYLDKRELADSTDIHLIIGGSCLLRRANRRHILSSCAIEP